MTLALAAGPAVAGSGQRGAGAATTIRPLKVLVLGDSYASGTGAHLESPGPAGCHRSGNGWFGLYVQALLAQGFNVHAVNRACDGAVVADLWRPVVLDRMVDCRADVDDELYRPAAPPRPPSTVPAPRPIAQPCDRLLAAQVDAVDSDTDLVLLTIGGNDLQFRTVAEQCFGYYDAARCRAMVREQASAVQAAITDFEKPVEPAKGDADPLARRLVRAFRDLRDKGPAHMKVVLVTYPYLERREDYRVGDYAAGREIREAGQALDRLQLRALRAVWPDAASASECKPARSCARAPAILLDTVKAAFATHEPDARPGVDNPEGWLHEILTTRFMDPNPVRGFLRDAIFPCLPARTYECYHPNPEGHAALAALLEEYGAFGAELRAPDLRGSIDVVLTVDTTNSMNASIDAVKGYALELLDLLTHETRSFRFALVTYRDHPDAGGVAGDHAARLDLAFTSDPVAAVAAIRALSVRGGGDVAESVYSGLMRAIAVPWRDAVKKVIVQFGDAPPHDPEPVTGLVASVVSDAARAVDPAVVYAVDLSSSGRAGAGLRSIAEATGGRVVRSPTPAGVRGVLNEIVREAVRAPFAWLGGPYLVNVGSPVSLDARGSFSASDLVRYEWDLDGDGRYEKATTGPGITHVFKSPGSMLVGLRVTDARGLRAEATTMLVASVDGDLAPEGADNCPGVENPGQEDFDADGIGDACDATPGLPQPPARAAAPRATGPVIASAGAVLLIASLSGLLLGLRSRGRRVCDQCGNASGRSDHFCDRCGSPLPGGRR